MKNLIKIAAASAIALVSIFYINYNNNDNSLFLKDNLAVNHKQESNISKVKSADIPVHSQEFRSNEVIEAREGFISPCFHHSKN